MLQAGSCERSPDRTWRGHGDSVPPLPQNENNSSQLSYFQSEIPRVVYPERQILRFFLFAPLRVRMTSEGLGMTLPERFFTTLKLEGVWRAELGGSFPLDDARHLEQARFLLG